MQIAESSVCLFLSARSVPASDCNGLQCVQDALGWYVGEAGVAPVLLDVLQQRLAADMASGGEAATTPCR